MFCILGIHILLLITLEHTSLSKQAALREQEKFTRVNADASVVAKDDDIDMKMFLGSHKVPGTMQEPQCTHCHEIQKGQDPDIFDAPSRVFGQVYGKIVVPPSTALKEKSKSVFDIFM